MIDNDIDFRERARHLIQSRGIVTMNDVLEILRCQLPVSLIVRLVVIQGPSISKFKEFLFRIGLWFIKRSGLEIREGGQNVRYK